MQDHTPPLVLGCARLGSALTPLNREQCLALLHEAHALGVHHFDTASVYGQGDSERYIGEAFRGRRDEVRLSSKAGQRLSPLQSAMAHLKVPVRMLAGRRGGVRAAVARQRAGGLRYCFEPEFIARSIEDSLRRLQTDHLDIFYLHSPPSVALRDEQLMRCIERLRADGKFRLFGVSCDELALAREALPLPQVQVVQFEFDASAASADILATAQRLGKTALVRGLMRHAGEPEFEHALRDVRALPALGGVIVGTTNAQHLRANVAAFRRALS